MGTITSRKRKDNRRPTRRRYEAIGTDAQFIRKARLSTVSKCPGVDQAKGDGIGGTWCDRACEPQGYDDKKLIEQYLEEDQIRPQRENQKRHAESDQRHTWLDELDDSAMNSQLVEFAQWWLSEEGGGVQARFIT